MPLIEDGPYAGFERHGYACILLDPPWFFTAYDGKGGLATNARKWGLAAVHYEVTETPELKKLPVADLAAKDCAMFMWAVDSNLPEAFELGAAWGFCVGVGTRVLTRDLRWIPAEQLRVGDALIGFDEEIVGDRRYYRDARVLSTGVEMLDSYRITLETGEEIVSSAEHPWLVCSINPNGNPTTHRWVRTKDLLARGHRPQGGGRYASTAMIRVAPVALPDQSYEAGFLAGALRFLMETRPPRLLEKWQKNNLVSSLYNMDKVLIKKVEHIGASPCVTLMTSTATYIAEGFGAHNTYKTIAFNWVKSREGYSPWPSLGYWTRKGAEICLLFTRGSPKRLRKDIEQVVFCPRGAHSAKPEIVYERIEALVGGPRIELFARHTRPGWAGWGSQYGIRDGLFSQIPTSPDEHP